LLAVTTSLCVGLIYFSALLQRSRNSIFCVSCYNTEYMTQLVGIANITPDSFSGDGHGTAVGSALAHIERIYEEGAVMADIGAESTRPGATPLSADEEWLRLEPILNRLPYDRPVSLDTYHPETIERAVRLLGNITVNDMTGLTSNRMVDVIVRYGLRCIAGHLPEAACANPARAHIVEPISSLEQVRDDVLRRREALIRRGVNPASIIVDPGIGFGKTRAVNEALLEFPLHVPDIPVMIGYSHKKMLGEHRFEIERNVAAGHVAILAKAAFLRVHEVAPYISAYPSLRA
jgi:dihydropteroate synthase